MTELFFSWMQQMANFNALIPPYWLWVFAIILVALLANALLRRLLNKLLGYAKESSLIWDDILLIAIKGPLYFFIYLFGAGLLALVIAQATQLSWLAAIINISRVGLIIIIIWVLTAFIRLIRERLIDKKYMDNPMDPTSAQAVCRLLQIALVITGGLIILEAMGFSTSGVLTFGGIGGIAIGFAAKDLLANFFGTIMIYLDKPFKIGDWIRSPDKDIEGVVENIGWRLTSIRTFNKRVLYLPNSLFNQILVENPSQMSHRRIYEVIGIRYADIHNMDAIAKAVKTMLEEHIEIDTTQTLMVNFNQFSESSIDFFVYVFTKTTNWVRFHQIKHEILLAIAAIIEKQGAEIAFPTSVVVLQPEALEEPSQT